MKKRYKLIQAIENVAKRGLIIKHQSLSGLFASEKTDSMVWFESNLEKDFAISLEFHSMVNYYEEQPLVIEFWDGDKQRTYTPDFLIHFHASEGMKPWLCEVKYKEDLRTNLHKYKTKFKAAMAHCEREGWEFKLITEDYIRTTFLENAKFLMRYKYDMVDQGCYTRMLTTINDLRLTSPEEFMLTLKDAHFNVKGRCLYALWYAVKIGEVNCDITQKLTMKTEIWPTSIMQPTTE